MFSQKKSFFKGKLFYILLIGIFVFGYWINQGATDLKDAKGISAESRQPVEKEQENQKTAAKQKKSSILDSMASGNERSQSSRNAGTTSTNNAIADEEQSIPDEETQTLGNSKYYFVKETGGIVKVYLCDENGTQSLLRTSDIDYSLLSEEDQVLFEKGIVKNSEEELNELLQDFES